MATGTYFIEGQDILNKVWNPGGTQGGTSDSITVTNNPGTALMGTVTLAGTGGPGIGSGSGQNVAGSPYLVQQPSFRQFILDTTTTSGASATGTTTTGLGGYRHALFLISFSTFTGTVSTADIYIDSRLDGTNYFNLAHINYTSATGGTVRDVVVLQKNGFSTGVMNGVFDYVSVAADLTAPTMLNIGWGDDFRIRRNVSGGTTAPIFTYTITVNLTA